MQRPADAGLVPYANYYGRILVLFPVPPPAPAGHGVSSFVPVPFSVGWDGCISSYVLSNR
jgi:hypothetical protein